MTDVLSLLVFTIMAPATVAAGVYWVWGSTIQRQRRRYKAKSDKARATAEAALKAQTEAAARIQQELEGIRRLNTALLLDTDRAEKEIARLRDEAVSHQMALTPISAERDAIAAERNALSTQLLSIHGDLQRVDAQLYRRLRDLPAHDQRHLREAMEQHKPQDYIAMAHHAAELKQRLEALREVWLDPYALEGPARDLLCTNLWVFEPALRNAGHIFSERGLASIAEGYFPRQSVSVGKFLDPARKADAAGIFLKREQVCREHPQGKPVFVIIEAKRNSVPVDDKVIEEAYHYALQMRMLVPALANWDFECFAIGGTIAADTRVQHHRPGSKGNTITVTPMSWRGLYERAASIMPAPGHLKSIEPNGPVPDHLIFDEAAALAAGNGEPASFHSESFDAIPLPSARREMIPSAFPDLSLPRAAE